jgi:molybdate transport system regulatory protein
MPPDIAMTLAIASTAPETRPMANVDPSYPRIRLRIRFDGDGMIGPGRAELMDWIAKTGSISAAGRAMGMSYKRAWMLVEVLNAAFRSPLVESIRGGSGGGGARLTETGQQVLRHYRAIEAAALSHGADDLAALRRLMLPVGPSAISEQK